MLRQGRAGRPGVLTVELVLPDAWRAGTWAHGTTHAITAWTGDEGGLIARLSVATIASPGWFSSFVGYDRWLTVLDGAVTLERATSRHRLGPGDALAFAGDEPLHATGAATVLNVIARRGLAWRVGVVADGTRLTGPGHVAVFATAALEVALDDEVLRLPARATAIATWRTPVRLRVNGARAIVVECGPCDSSSDSRLPLS